MSEEREESPAELCLLALLGLVLFACVAGRHGCGQEGSLRPADVPPAPKQRPRKGPMKSEILFRQLNAPVPSWLVPGCRFVVEFWQDEMAYPVAQAWVLVPLVPPGPAPLPWVFCPCVDWIEVMPGFRRRGVATALLDAIKVRWPEAAVESATPDGQAFLAAYVERR